LQFQRLKCFIFFVSVVKKTKPSTHGFEYSVSFFPLQFFKYYGVVGAAGAGAGAASGAGAGAASGAGAGASVTPASGFCSSCFLQPTTANDKVTKKSREKITAKIFFIDTLTSFQRFFSLGDDVFIIQY
jgi:hypothetical protein